VRLRRFLRTPKGLLLVILVFLAALAALSEGLRQIAPGLTGAILVAALMDLVLLRYRHHRWEFPSGAILTGLIIAMVLSPHEPWYVGAASSAIAIAGKYVFRYRLANVFNPAALGLVATFYVFSPGQNWWGAVPNLMPVGLVALVATGAFIAHRVNKMPMVLAFLGGYYTLFTITAFLGDPARVAEIFRSPDLQAVLYFAVFILTDPPTSPVRYPDQVVCGVTVALVSFGVFELIGAAYYLLAGVLAGNLWEARRRAVAWAHRQPAASLPAKEGSHFHV